MIGSARCAAVTMLAATFGSQGCSGTAHVEPGLAPRPELPRKLGFEDLRSALVDTWRPMGAAGAPGRWTVPLSGGDLAELRVLLAKARRLDASPQGMFLTSRQGVLHTKLGDYEFVVGEEKIATGTYRASCWPVGAPDGREEVHLQWSEQDGRQVMVALRRLLVANAAEATRAGHVSRRQ